MVLKPREARPFLKEGWKKADLHMHTWNSYDVLRVPSMNPARLLRKARRKLDYVSFTDHDNMDSYNESRGEMLVKGVELEVLDEKRVGHTVHMNLYGLDKELFEDLKATAKDEKNIYRVISKAKKNNLRYTYNHPFWFKDHESFNPSKVMRLADKFPVLEYNTTMIKPFNEITLWIAKKKGKGVIANTDTHIGSMGTTYTLSQGDTFEEFFDNVKRRNAFIVPRDMNKNLMLREIIQRINHFFNPENEPKKDFRLGVHKKVDSIVDFFTNNRIRKVPYIDSVLRTAFLKAANRSGRLINNYFEKQMLLAEEIKNKLRIKEKNMY